MIYAVDSRSVNMPAQTIFFAIKGRNHDGHDYVDSLYSKGVRNFVVSERRPGFDNLAGASFRYVNDTLAELQREAAEHRRKCGAEIAGITGSNGKTVVKEWIAQLIGQDVALYRSPRSYNSQVGVPLSLLGIEEGTEVALIEAGMSQKGEMGRLERMIKPDVGIFTYFGDAHGENFSSEEERLNEKLSLFKGCGCVICREGRISRQLEKTVSKDAVKIFWGESDGASVKVQTVSVSQSSRTVRVTDRLRNSSENTRECLMEIPFPDEASFENCITSISYLLYKGCDLKKIALRVKNLQPVAMRMEIKEGVNGCTIIKDYYNSDLASFGLAVDTLARQDASKEKVVILSDFVDVGMKAESLYKEVARLLADAGVSLFIGIGENISGSRDLFKNISSRFYCDTENFLSAEHRDSFKNQIILIKGARKYRFEYIGNFLQKQSHATLLEVDLDALAANLNHFRSIIPAGTKMAVMVKAFSYGNGLDEVANLLQYNGVDYLMVAYADEGVELRMNGITMPIAVMNPEPESFDDMIESDLEPEIYSTEILKEFDVALRKHGTENYPVHLKLNTGMNRSGVDKKDIPELISFIKGRRSMIVRSMFSHLAASDDPAEDDFTLGQISLFREIADMVQRHFPYKIIRHILNSAGIERFPQYSFDMVRLGIGLYGIGSHPSLQPISSFKTHIVSIREVAPGQTVGYGRKGKVLQDSRIALIPVGYADGLDRHLSCGAGEMFVRGKRVKIIGNICMDACMLDVTGTDAAVGDEVEIFGKHIPVTEIAEKLGTIPYEVLTGISRRVKRVYYKE